MLVWFIMALNIVVIYLIGWPKMFLMQPKDDWTLCYIHHKGNLIWRNIRLGVDVDPLGVGVTDGVNPLGLGVTDGVGPLGLHDTEEVCLLEIGTLDVDVSECAVHLVVSVTDGAGPLCVNGTDGVGPLGVDFTEGVGIFSANVTNGVAQQGVKKVGVGVTEGVRPFGVDFIDRTGQFGEVVTDGVRLLDIWCSSESNSSCSNYVRCNYTWK